MRITVCELPHEPLEIERVWAALCQHTRAERSELLLLPEFALVDAVWERASYDSSRWAFIVGLSASWLRCFPQLGVRHVVGSRPINVGTRRFNQGFRWSAEEGVIPLRSKFYLPDEPAAWEARWFDPGDPKFPVFQADELAFGLNICTELWALETYTLYADSGVHAVLAPRATASATTAKWLAMGVVSAVRSGAYSISSNRVDPTGTTGGGGGWIIDPEGKILALTRPEAPFMTVDVDLGRASSARGSYPRNVFARGRNGATSQMSGR